MHTALRRHPRRKAPTDMAGLEGGRDPKLRSTGSPQKIGRARRRAVL